MTEQKKIQVYIFPVKERWGVYKEGNKKNSKIFDHLELAFLYACQCYSSKPGTRIGVYGHRSLKFQGEITEDSTFKLL